MPIPSFTLSPVSPIDVPEEVHHQVRIWARHYQACEKCSRNADWIWAADDRFERCSVGKRLVTQWEKAVKESYRLADGTVATV